MLSVQPGLRGRNDLRVGRKMATFQLFFQSGRAKDLSAPLYVAPYCSGVLKFHLVIRQRKFLSVTLDVINYAFCMSSKLLFSCIIVLSIHKNFSLQMAQ